MPAWGAGDPGFESRPPHMNTILRKEDIELFVDLYELNMGYADFNTKNFSKITESYFLRKIPEYLSTFVVVCGLEQVINFITNFKFKDKHVEWLQKNFGYSDDYIEFLKKLKFKGDIYAMPEASIAFANEPIINITGSTITVQLFETYILNMMNFQTLIATKAARCYIAAKKRILVDFGARRAHGRDAAILAARASYIAGFNGTSLVVASKMFNIPCFGTMAHKFIQDRNSEETAFEDFAKTFRENAILVIDTYKSENAIDKVIRIAKKLEKDGIKIKGIRLDSGNIVKISKIIRKKLDKNNLKYIKIFVSGDIDEYKIYSFLKNKAPIDGFGVGTRLVTGANYNSLEGKGGISVINGVFKMVEKIEDGRIVGKYKISDSPDKSVIPFKKQVFRIVKNNKFRKDIIGLWDEDLEGERYLVEVIRKGKLRYTFPSLKKLRENFFEQLEMLEEKYKKILNPEIYPVYLSKKLKDTWNYVKRKYI